METQSQYGVRKAQVTIPTRDLLVVPHRDGILTVSHPVFGSNPYDTNVVEMQRTYTHSQELPQISFKEPTTSQSVSATAYEFPQRAKPQIFDKRWLQAGRIVRTNEGIIANPPRDSNGAVIFDLDVLKAYIDNAKKIQVGKSNIYLGLNDFGFAPYETFQTGVQDCDTFAQGGLARVIEHTEGPAENLRAIALPKNYPRGVNVFGFKASKEPVERVLTLDSDRYLGSGRLVVDGGGWYGCYGGVGFAFGVL